LAVLGVMFGSMHGGVACCSIIYNYNCNIIIMLWVYEAVFVVAGRINAVAPELFWTRFRLDSSKPHGVALLQ
jgi:hypothetical protein